VRGENNNFLIILIIVVIVAFFYSIPAFPVSYEESYKVEVPFDVQEEYARASKNNKLARTRAPIPETLKCVHDLYYILITMKVNACQIKYGLMT
jgi:hypothetical protein